MNKNYDASIRRVLAVDDEPNILELIADVLVSDGWIVDKAVNADEAMEYFRLYEYDLITLDCRMPGMKGQDFHRMLSRTFGYGKRTSGILPRRIPPTLVITASYDHDDVQEMALNEGVVGILNKPVEILKLVEIAHDTWLMGQQLTRRRRKALSRISDRLVSTRSMASG